MPTKMPKFSQQTQNTNSQPIFTSSATHNHNQKQLPSPNKAKYITHSFIAKQIHTHTQTYHNWNQFAEMNIHEQFRFRSSLDVGSKRARTWVWVNSVSEELLSTFWTRKWWVFFKGFFFRAFHTFFQGFWLSKKDNFVVVSGVCGDSDGEDLLVMKLVMEDDKDEEGIKEGKWVGFGLVMERIAFVNFANVDLTYFIIIINHVLDLD